MRACGALSGVGVPPIPDAAAALSPPHRRELDVFFLDSQVTFDDVLDIGD